MSALGDALDRYAGTRDTYWYLSAWAHERGLTRPHEITKPILERYQRHLFLYRKDNGQPLSTRSQHVRLTPVRGFFKWLARQNHILYNPASRPRPAAHGAAPAQARAQCSRGRNGAGQPDPREPIGMRDRAMLETFYSTGMRRMELIDLGVPTST